MLHLPSSEYMNQPITQMIKETIITMIVSAPFAALAAYVAFNFLGV